MPVLGQGSPAHKGHQHVVVFQKLPYMVRRAVGDALYLEAESGQASRDQAVVGAALAGVIPIGCRPVGHLHRGDGGGGKAVDQHGHAHRAAAVFCQAV